MPRNMVSPGTSPHGTPTVSAGTRLGGSVVVVVVVSGADVAVVGGVGASVNWGSGSSEAASVTSGADSAAVQALRRRASVRGASNRYSIVEL